MASIKYFSLLMVCVFQAGCSSLYHYQVGEIDNTHKVVPIMIRESELGVDLSGALKAVGSLNKAFKGSPTVTKTSNTVADIWDYITMGPKTGHLVFSDRYAAQVYSRLIKQCPTGYVTGLTAVRESADYPFVSGEIVRVSGYCVVE